MPLGNQERLIQAGEKLEDVSRTISECVTDFAAVVTLDNQASQDEPAKMLAGGFHFDLQLLANLPDAKIRAPGQQLEDFDPAVVGEAFDHPLELLGPSPLGPDHAFARSHAIYPSMGRPRSKHILTFLRMLEYVPSRPGVW